MKSAQRHEASSARRLFASHAAISLVPVVLIGLLLAHSYQREAERRGLGEARAQAALIATTVIEPQLFGVDLREGLTPSEEAALDEVATRTTEEGTVLRMRVRDLDGRVVYSLDGSGFEDAPDHHAVEAGKGADVVELTKINTDANDIGPAGDDVVEVYRALETHPGDKTFGVLEMYLPYAPIRADVTSGLSSLYRDLAVGLFVLYIVLAGLSLTTTRRIRKQSELNTYLAEHDQLTGLPNRDAFLHRLATMTEREPGQIGAVAILDIDRFKDINDTLGHDIGDQLLKLLADRLANAFRPGDVVARIGGDEFGVILPRVVSQDQTENILERVRAIVAAPLQITELPLTVESSIGYVLMPDDGHDPQTLLQRADIAMYVAKASRTNPVRYTPEHDHFDADRLALVGELQRALTNDELVLHYQPKLDLVEDSVGEVEALIRWNHPRHGLLQPDKFLPVAEQTGLIDPLTDWVLTRALGQLREWDEQGQAFAVAVNVSARNLAQSSFPDRVLGIVARSGVSPERIVLEITETALFTDVEKATGALERLRDSGLRIALDDFGQGQTSLGFLARLPVVELKVDRAFVTTMCVDAANAAIVRSVIDLAHNLGMTVVAEGVEDTVTIQTLRRMGCDTVQGYTIARPMPADDVVPWVEQSVYVPSAH